MSLDTQIRFDAASALSAHSHQDRVQSAADQDKLDIAAKQRTSVMPWRGQFSPQLIEHLLEKHSNEGDRVVDPFCGSGTVLYEAAARHIHASGYDVNPAAIILARFSKVCGINTEGRHKAISASEELARVLLDSAMENNDEVLASSLPDVLHKFDAHDDDTWLYEAFLLFAFGNSTALKAKKLVKSQKNFRDAVLSAPQFNGDLLAEPCDARKMPLDNGSCDYLVTSPPYINVFNYHQNYRPVTEAMGYLPLVAARSEVGANRKFRQNRFMTVTQYCMDIAEALVEMFRVLKTGSLATIILGRTSNVRSVSFKNGELIAAIANEGLGAKIVDWNERKFLNRFGETIYEDVITLKSVAANMEDAIAIGREVGTQALRNALGNCPDDRRDEIEQAIEASPKIEKSEYFTVR